MSSPTTPTGIPAAASISHDFVLSKCDYFVDVQLWPVAQRLNPRAWLSNFKENEMAHAVHLLNTFVYFSRPLTEQLFKSAFQNLSMAVTAAQPMRRARAAWASFVDSIIVTRITGEDPSDTDSSHIYARMARQALGIQESRVLSPSETIRQILNQRGRLVLFVDDFVGTGNQFLATWHRSYEINGSQLSFQRVASTLSNVEWFYCPVLCTEYGRGEHRHYSSRGIAGACSLHSESIQRTCYRQRSVAPSSRKYRSRLRPCASQRAGIPEGEWKGFHGLGLAIAFEDSVPDATLPIFYWSENAWQPLLERT